MSDEQTSPAGLVWLFAPACSGKKTLIRAVADDTHHPARPFLGLPWGARVSEMILPASDRHRRHEVIEGMVKLGGWTIVHGQAHDIPELVPEFGGRVNLMLLTPEVYHSFTGSRYGIPEPYENWSFLLSRYRRLMEEAGIEPHYVNYGDWY